MPKFQLNYDSDDWGRKAYRILDAGGTLVGVPEDKLKRVSNLADQLNQDIAIDETEEGWRIEVTDQVNG